LSAPVASGEIVITVGPDQVLGVDVATGGEGWSVPRDEGPPTTPAVATLGERTVVVYTEGFGDGPGAPDASGSASAEPSVSSSASPSAGDGGDGGGDGGGGAGGDEPFDSHLAAFDLATREPLWDPVPLSAVSRTGVVVDGGTAFVGVNGGTVYAVDLNDGSISWTAELGRPLGTPLTVADSTVLVGLQLEAAGTLPTLVALDATDGEERWRVDDDSAAGVIAAAAVGQGRAFVTFSGRQESSVDGIDLETGRRLWRTGFPRFFDPTATAPPVVTDDAVFVADFGGQVFALDPATGNEIWDFALNESVFQSAPVAVASHVIVGTLEGTLTALDGSSGNLVWRSDTSDESGPIRSLAVIGDRLVVVRAGGDGGLSAFEHDPDGILVDEESPTRPDPVALAGGIAAAGLIVGGLTLVLGRVLSRRVGPAFDEGDSDDFDPGPDDDADPDDDPGTGARDPEGTTS
jgi:outer membrane protein assembly factor BamB